MLDYQSLQWKLMPMLATTYALHFAKNLLVDMYCEMKRSRDEDLIADVHSFSAGGAGSPHTHPSFQQTQHSSSIAAHTGVLTSDGHDVAANVASGAHSLLLLLLPQPIHA